MHFTTQTLIFACSIVLLLPASAAQPAWVASLPGPPPTCSAKVVKGIQWGAATSAYQVEGGWNASGRTPSVWDTLAQTPGKIADNSTGDVAADMYNRWPQDIALMKSLGIKNYRLSVSWNRIVPQGVAGSPINMAGVRWYRNFITALLQAGIKPAVTLFHWDLPQVLQDKYQGFMDPRIQDDYLYYAGTMFAQLGDLVDQWMTFNEVISICELGYQKDVFAPAMNLGVRAKYMCGHNIILAHAKAVQLYRQKYRPTQNGRISIALDGKWGYPRNPNSQADLDASDHYMQFQYGWMADPIYFGDYPKIMRDTQASLPKFSESDKALLRANVIDFLSINFYTGYWVWAPEAGADKSQVFVVVEPFISPGTKTNAAWLFKTPDALRKTIVWLHKRYKGPEFWITESGVSGPDEESKGRQHAVNDAFRLDYYNTYLDEMCKAITTDGANVTHYYAWSLLDNFEWRDGFNKRFGIIYVDLNDNLSRHPKSSAYWLSKHFYKPGPLPALNTKQRQVAAKPASG